MFFTPVQTLHHCICYKYSMLFEKMINICFSNIMINNNNNNIIIIIIIITIIIITSIFIALKFENYEPCFL